MQKHLKIYMKFVLTGITFLLLQAHPCLAQEKPVAVSYKAIIQQADQALAAKDYAGALLLYEKANQAKPEYNYASGKIDEINKILNTTPVTKSQLFEDIIIKAENFYNRKEYPQAKSEYQKAILIDPSAQFPKDRLAQINSVYTDPDDMANFNIAIANGDNALAANDFDKAIVFYEAALALHPNTKFAKEKIAAARKQQADYKLTTEQAAKLIAGADKLLETGKHAEARSEYQKALYLAPANQYAKQKVQEIDAYFLNIKALQENFDKSIEQADQFYINRDFTNARLKYQEALNAKPDARYPKEMLEKTKSGEALLQSDQQKYDAAIASAENFVQKGDYETALLGYKSALEIKPSENYPKTKIAEIDKQLNEINSRRAAYDIALKNGDQSFNEKKYDVALGHYRAALSLFPEEKYPSKRINEITEFAGKQKESDENFRKSITEADKLFKQNKFEESIAVYSQALVFKPGEAYPQQRITEANEKIAATKNKKEIYANAIASGDRLLAEAKYEEALQAYEFSRTVNPFEEYPISKMSEINFLLNKYDKEIDKGNKALASGKYDVALKSFQDASAIKPAEQFPQQKINETKVAAETRQKTDEAFSAALKTGDQMFAGKEYDRALVAYTEAASLKANEKYPQDQIGRINKILGDQRSVDENYAQAISAADNSFNNEKLNEALVSYKKAISLKPAETYPKTQAEKINETLATKAKLEADYASAIAAADKLFIAKKYEDAVVEYRKAQALKPSEKYPSDRIAEAEKTLADAKAIQEWYDKAIAEGDKLFLSRDYLPSIESFKTANTIKPGEIYPKQKITEIQAIIDKNKAEDQRYQEAIAQADKLFADNKLPDALEPYLRAAKIKPTEKYPLDQVDLITRQLDALKKLENNYQNAISEAESQFKAGNYTDARSLFSTAESLKPTEKLPKDKIAEIDGLLADIQLKDQNYKKAISEGDALFTGKKYAEATTSYNSALTLKPGESYPKSQLEKINKLLLEQQKLDNDFLTLVSSADQFFDVKKYNEAIADYRKALALKPTEKYPTDKIAEAENIISRNKALQATYDKAIEDADKMLAAKDYENALILYTQANTAKPSEAYASNKITEIQAIIDKQKAENSKYGEAIALADKFFKAQKYFDALEPYQRASSIKPFEKYPQEQLARINTLIAEQKKLNEDYQKLIADADILMKDGKFEEARGIYANAATLKPQEKLPKDKMAEISSVIATAKLKEENYAKVIQKANDQYIAKNLQGAVKSYEEALTIKPDEKFPQDRIEAIKAELKTTTDSYAKAIALGDSKLASGNLMEALNAYQNALEIKPGEAYPKTKINEINTALLAQKEELEKMYASYVSEGDKLMQLKDYGAAQSAFTKAKGIKPGEAYPNQRITEITKIVEEIELARRAEYNKALGEADKLFNTKVFDQAIDAYEAAARINPGDAYPAQQISKIRKFMSDHAIHDLFSQTLVINEGSEKKFTFSAIEPRLRKNNYILLKARSTGKTAPKVYLNYGKDNMKNGGIVLRNLDKSTINDYLIRISIQDKWYREDNNWISLSVESGSIEITKVQIAAGD